VIRHYLTVPMASLNFDATLRAGHAQRLEAPQILQYASEQRQSSRSSTSSSQVAIMKGAKEKDYSRPKANSDASRVTASGSAHSDHIGHGKVRSLPRKF
jgi:hypothetical protein